MATPPAKPAVPPADTELRYWTTSWSLQNIDLQTLTKRLELIGFEVPVDATGTASVNFQIGVPLGRLATTRAYRFRGSLAGRDVQIDNLTLPELFADIVYDDGTWKLTRFDGKTKSGSFTGSATATVDPAGQFKADLAVEQVNLQPLIELFGNLTGQTDLRTVRGSVDGQVVVSGSVDQIQDFAKWNAKGRLTTNNFSVGQSSKFAIDVDQFTLQDQLIRMEGLAMSSPDHPEFFLRGSGEISLDQSQRFAVNIAGNDVPTADLLGLYFRSSETLASGKVDLKGTVQGQLGTTESSSANIEANLLIASPDLQVFGLDVGLLEHRLQLTSDRLDLQPLFESNADPRRKVESIQASYAIAPKQITVRALTADVLGGSISGSGTFARDPSGTHRVDTKWEGIEPSGQFSLPWMSRRVRGAAKTSGSLRWSAPADKVNFPAFHQADAQVQVESLQLDGESLGSLSAKLQINDSQFSLAADGELLDGSIDLTSTATIESTTGWADIPQMMLGGQLIIRGLSIGDAVRVLSESKSRRFAGRLDADVDFQLRPDSLPQWKSKLTLRDLRVDQQRISQQLDVQLSQQKSVIKLTSLEGAFAGGRIEASGQWALAAGNRTMKVRLTRARGRQLLLPFTASGDQWIAGLVSGRAIVSGVGVGPADGIRVVGSLRLIHGQVYGVAVGNAHSPFRAQLNTSPLVWRAIFPKIQAKFVRGNLSGSLKVSSPVVGSGIDLDSRWRMTHVDFEDLLGTFVGTNTIGRGDMTGDLSLSGRRIRSVDDLQGNFRLKFGGTDATAVPGLSAAGSTLGALSLSGTRFTDGEANGQISQGAVRMERLVMSADRLKVQASGRVFLSGSRMDIRALIETGNFQGQELLSSQLAPAALGSLTPLMSVNQLLSDRSFVLDLNGTLKDPQVRLLASETIQANVRRRLVRSAIGLVIGDAVFVGD